MPRAQIKDEEVYEAVRRDGASKEMAAKIANAAAAKGRSTVGRKGGKARDYGGMSVADLRDRAKEIGIEGRSKMTKDELIKALRNH